MIVYIQLTIVCGKKREIGTNTFLKQSKSIEIEHKQINRSSVLFALRNNIYVNCARIMRLLHTYVTTQTVFLLLLICN